MIEIVQAPLPQNESWLAESANPPGESVTMSVVVLSDARRT